MKQITGYSLFITQYMPQDWFKCLKKKEAVSVFVCNSKAQEAEEIVKLRLG